MVGLVIRVVENDEELSMMTMIDELCEELVAVRVRGEVVEENRRGRLESARIQPYTWTVSCRIAYQARAQGRT